MTEILVIDDDPYIHDHLNLVLPAGFHLLAAHSVSEGAAILRESVPDLVLLDMKLPDGEGLSILESIGPGAGAPPVIMLTADGHVDTIVKSIRAGAVDYVVKPPKISVLAEKIHRATAIPRFTGREPDQFAEVLVGDDPAIREVRKRIRLYASNDLPVLIQGESGTGKELAAELVHQASRRAKGPYIVQNCAAIPEQLLESELFGSSRGAYTDAIDRAGCFELASGGTLLLDEIGEMPNGSQAKLLRALENKEIRRLGSSETSLVDARVVASTNRTLLQEVDGGRFRPDLYYRLHTLPLTLPPLRERMGDIPSLAAGLLGQKFARLQGSAVDRLYDHHWPGNVRELKNVLERGAIFAEDGPIEARHIQFD